MILGVGVVHFGGLLDEKAGWNLSSRSSFLFFAGNGFNNLKVTKPFPTSFYFFP